MDHFREEAVASRHKGANEVAYYAAIVAMVFTGIIAMMEISGVISMISNGTALTALIADIILGLVSAAICALIFLYRGRLRTEYEYTFTNGDLAFAAVYNNVKRKSLGNLNVKTVDAFGPVNSGAFNRYVSMQGVKQTRWFLNRDGNLYFFYFQKENNKRLIVFEPTDEMVGDIKFYLPHGAYQEH